MPSFHLRDLNQGLSIKAWTPNTFRKIASLWGEYVEREDVDLKSLSCKHLCLKTNMKVIINERQKVIIQGKVYWIRVKELDAWFPNFQEDDQDDLSSDGESQEGDVANKADNNKSDVDRVSESSFMHENNTAHKDELNNRNAMEISQKAKIRWSIEGDENSKYFHGIMNKKRSQLAIRGTLANGEWISEPHRVKNDFFTHFKKQFSPIQASSICFDVTILTHLSSDQVQVLECTVTYEEVKRDVWDCGTNKSPGPDGFSF
nr:RNA-directed DNA polymerase, eukaryota [Tanacetum cinerariifolium]